MRYVVWRRKGKMKNPIENLGDYNIAREAVKAFGGSWDTVYKNIGDTAVAKATPRIFRKGGIVGSLVTAGVIGASYLGYKGYCFMKDRKQKIENEPNLKKEFNEALKSESPMENEEPADGTNNVEPTDCGE